MKATLEVKQQQFRAIDTALTKLRNVTSQAGARAVAKMAFDFETDIKARYQAGPGPDLAASTKQKRAQGKRAGRYPAIPAGGGGPLNRTGRLIQLVERKRTGSLRNTDIRVRIRPGILMPFAGPGRGQGRSDQVASVMEFGAAWNMKLTSRARYYLRALAMGIAGTDQKLEKVGNLQEIFVTIYIPPRPVWVPAILELNSDPLFGARGFIPIFAAELMRATKLPIVFVSG